MPHLQIYTAQSLKYEAKNPNPNSEQKCNYRKGEEQGEEHCEKERGKKEVEEISLEAI